MAAAGRHVVVVGGGAVGVGCALYARRRGWNVTLVDPRGIAGGASRGNAGVLAVSECVPIGSLSTLRGVPGMLLSRDGPLHIRPQYFPRLLPWLLRMLAVSTPRQVARISAALADLLREAVAAHVELAQAAGVHDRIVRSGWLKAYEHASRFQAAADEYALMRSRGVSCEELDNDGIARLDPVLDGRFEKAIFHPECHHVGDPQAYVRALGERLSAEGARIVSAEVQEIELRAGRVVGVRTSAGTIAADALVVAAGAWSKQLAASLGCEIPLDTERGYHMMLDASNCPIRLQRPLYWAEKSIVLAPMGDAVRVTSSVEFAGIDAPPDYELVLRFVADVERLLPGVRLIPGHTWLGFRPSMPDSMPVIGAAPDVPNAFLAFGHGHLGVTLGAITGKLVGSLLDGETPAISLAPFAPSRFRLRGKKKGDARHRGSRLNVQRNHP